MNIFTSLNWFATFDVFSTRRQKRFGLRTKTRSLLSMDNFWRIVMNDSVCESRPILLWFSLYMCWIQFANNLSRYESNCHLHSFVCRLTNPFLLWYEHQLMTLVAIVRFVYLWLTLSLIGILNASFEHSWAKYFLLGVIKNFHGMFKRNLPAKFFSIFFLFYQKTQ